MGTVNGARPLDWLILIGTFLAGSLMISDRRLPKFSKGAGMNLSLFLLIAMFVATTIQIAGYTTDNGALTSFILLGISATLILVHVIMGPKICDSMFNKQDSH